MQWSDPAHPMWPLARIIVMMSALVAILKMNASHFDATELKTILTMFFLALGGEGVQKALQRVFPRREDA